MSLLFSKERQSEDNIISHGQLQFTLIHENVTDATLNYSWGYICMTVITF